MEVEAAEAAAVVGIPTCPVILAGAEVVAEVGVVGVEAGVEAPLRLQQTRVAQAGPKSLDHF